MTEISYDLITRRCPRSGGQLVDVLVPFLTDPRTLLKGWVGRFVRVVARPDGYEVRPRTILNQAEPGLWRKIHRVLGPHGFIWYPKEERRPLGAWILADAIGVEDDREGLES